MANLRSRLRGGESNILEFKSIAPEPARLARTLCAFSNSAGGNLFIGVDDKGRVVGLEDVDRDIGVLKHAQMLIDPEPVIHIERVVHDLMDVIAVRVDEIDYPNYSELVDGRPYFRVGSFSTPIDRHTERAMVRLRRHVKGDRTVSPEGRRLIDFLLANGEMSESRCAHHLNFSSNRLRKLAERLVGGGYLLPMKMGQGRTYVAIHP